MANFNSVILKPKGFLHTAAFEEVRSSLAWSLSALGHNSMSTDNGFASGATNIILGAETLPPGTQLPPGSIIFSLEQPTHPNMPIVRDIAKRSGCIVWDYNQKNLPDWQKAGITAHHVPIGYTPNLSRIPKAATQDIDVLFYGWLTPRRLAILGALHDAGLKAVFTDSSYGGGRDQLISRAKVCLNVNHDGRDLFNIVRVSFLLANSKCVVSEMASDGGDYASLSVVVAPYDRIVKDCQAMVTDDFHRNDCEKSALPSIQQRDFTATVARALEGGANATNGPISPVESTIPGGAPSRVNGTSAKLLDRYKRGCLSGDMAAFLPWLREHAKGQILEIGTRDGASTSALLLGLETNGGHLTSLDVQDCSGLWTHPQWTFHRANSLNAEFPDATFDVILIDGDHSRATYVGDLYNAYHWTKPGGLILSHDIVPERGHEFYAVALREEFFKFAKEKGLEHYELPGRYGMGVMKKGI